MKWEATRYVCLLHGMMNCRTFGFIFFCSRTRFGMLICDLPYKQCLGCSQTCTCSTGYPTTSSLAGYTPDTGGKYGMRLLHFWRCALSQLSFQIYAWIHTQNRQSLVSSVWNSALKYPCLPVWLTHVAWQILSKVLKNRAYESLPSWVTSHYPNKAYLTYSPDDSPSSK